MGYTTIPIKEAPWREFLTDWVGIRSGVSLLSSDEKQGREILPATPDTIRAVNRVWSNLEGMGLTQGKAIPPIVCFKESMSGESQCLGFSDGTRIAFNTDIASGDSFMLHKVALEEIVHHVTGATDNSRDFQDYLLRIITELIVG